MKILWLVVFGAFLSINAFAGVDCVSGKSRPQERDNLRRLISKSNQSGFYIDKKTFGKNIEYRKGYMYNVAGVKKDCRRQNCKLSEFCEVSVFDRNKRVEKYCIGASLPVRTDPMIGRHSYGCVELDSLKMFR